MIQIIESPILNSVDTGMAELPLQCANDVKCVDNVY